jgi:hypothetical protein
MSFELPENLKAQGEMIVKVILKLQLAAIT